jgi:hypothetical protein
VTWGMEDPAARAREGMSLEADESWSGGGGPPRRRRPHEGLWVILFIVLSAAAIAFVLQREDDAAANDPRLATIRGDIVGLSERSLVRPVNFAPILGAAREEAAPQDRVRSVRVAPTTVQFTMVTPAGRQYFLEAGIDGRVRERDFANVPSLPTSRLSDIDPADIRRAVVTVARESGLPPARLDYLVLNDPGPGQRFFVVFDAPTVGDRNWVGQGKGGRMRRSGPVPAQGREESPGTPGGSPGLSDALRIAQCLENAGNDIDAIRRCTE